MDREIGGDIREPQDTDSKQNNLSKVFWNRTEGRLRAGWRLTGLVLTFIFVALIIGIIAKVFISESPPYGGHMITNVVMIIAVGLAVRFLDHRKFSGTGLSFDHNWFKDLLFGLLVGMAMMAIIFLFEYYAGWIKITGMLNTEHPGDRFISALIVPIIYFTGVGIAEELAFRGYFLLNLAEGMNSPAIGPRKALVLAWVITSVTFGFAHMFNPNASLISSINISMAGIFLGLAFVYTGSLAIPIGIHISWNFFEGVVFGFPVSGQRFSDTEVFSIEQYGPDIMTGGAFGPEAGILGLGGMVFGMLVTFWWIKIRYGRTGLYTELAEPPNVNI